MTPMPAVIKSYATVRDAKLAESGYDKVAMSTGGSCEDVVRASVWLGRFEMRHGTSGQSDQTVPTCFTDPELDALTDALPEDVDFCKDGETTIASDGAIVILGDIFINDDGQEAGGETELTQMLLQARPAFRRRGNRVVREDLNVWQKSRGFFSPKGGASGRGQGPRMKRSSFSTAETAHEVCKMSKTWTPVLASTSKGIKDNGTTKGPIDVQ